MQHFDVLIVGGGPAGSTCAAALVKAGLRVLVADKATFPRDKVCAGWITPAVVQELELDLPGYARDRTLDAIFGFRIGRMGDRAHVHRYEAPVSWGIRRCELDHYLLERCGAQLELGMRVDAVERAQGRWRLGDRFEADILVGAGGHFCPVARAVTPTRDGAVIAADETEFVTSEAEVGHCAVEPGLPELYFTPELDGYGWAFRKGGVFNIGLGVRATNGRDGQGKGPALRRRVEDFLRFLVEEGRISKAPDAAMKGHAYLLQPDSTRRRSGDGFVLLGDAAGLAYDRSGEGIRCAVESGILAARTIREARAAGRSDAEALAPYARSLEDRFGPASRDGDPAALVPAVLRRPLAAALMASSWFSRRVLLERWFLHAHEQPLAA